jgi:hypothetical protein
VKIAALATPIDFTSPKVATPVMRKSRAGPLAAMRTVSPIARPFFSAVPASRTTSPGPLGQAPSLRSNGVTRSKPGVAVSRSTPKYGPSPRSSPSALRIFVFMSVRSPTTVPASGTRRTASSAEAGIVGSSVKLVLVLS